MFRHRLGRIGEVSSEDSDNLVQRFGGVTAAGPAVGRFTPTRSGPRAGRASVP